MHVDTVTIPRGARGVDSAQRLSPATIRSLGAIFTCRYYAPWINGKRAWKCLTPAEIVELHGAGIAILPNWESSATRPLSGASAGSIDGREFARQLELDDVPHEALVIVSCDMNAVAGNRAAVEAYFRAALGELAGAGYTNQGVYGDTDLFGWLADLGIVGWLMVSPSFSDGTKNRVHIWQRYQSTWNNPRNVPLAGVPNDIYDPNDVLADVAGVWLPHEVEQPARPDVIDPPVTPPTPAPQEDILATARITVEGRNAQFYGTGTLMPDGSVHCVLVTWSGPGDQSFHQDHSTASDVVEQHYTPETLQRDLVLVGDPADIQDSLHEWSPADFFRVAA